jgi:beta-lactamase regulating signal transducer with metallopeptidase domain/TolB-like protein
MMPHELLTGTFAEWALFDAPWQWIAWMLPMAWQIAIVAGLAWLLGSANRRASAQFRHLLWLLVFVKLLLPPDISVPWSLTRWIPTVSITQQAGILNNHDRSEVNTARAAESQNTLLPPSPTSRDLHSTTVYTESLKKTLNPISIAMLIWVSVSLSLFLVLAVQWRYYTRRIRRSIYAAPESMQVLLRTQAQALGIRKEVALCVSDSVTTPGVFGAFRPMILLPSKWHERFSSDELSSILAHELAHIKRGDLWIGWLTAVLTCLYWFHPVVWTANLYLRREREMACDDLALAATKQEGKAYASTILRVAESFEEQVPAGVGLLGLLELSDNLLHRIRSLSDGTRARHNTWKSAFGLVLVALLLPMGPWRATAAATVANVSEAAGIETTMSAKPPVSGADIAARPAVEGPAGVALLDFSRVGSEDNLGELASKLGELLAEQLANTEGIRLVDRGALEKAMGELKLNQTGLVESAAATKVGKLVGARFFVTGKLMKLDTQWNVTAKLTDTETSEMAAVRVIGEEADGLVSLAQNTGTAIAARLASFSTRRSPGEVIEPMEQKTAELRAKLAGKPLPRVVVVVPESHIGTLAPDPAGENELVAVLKETGFPVVDVSALMKRQPGEWWMNLFFGAAQGRQGTELTIREGSRSSADILHDTRIEKLKNNADIFVMGEGFSEYAGDNYGFKTCAARLEIKALDTATEQIAVSISQHATAADIAELIAGKKALRTAGRQLGLDLAAQLADYWDKNAGKRNQSRMQ